MVVEIRIEEAHDEEDDFGYDDVDFGSSAYTLHADDHRILTIVTRRDYIFADWLLDVMKSIKKKLLIGVSVEHENLEYDKSGLRHKPYDLITLCIGSHSFIYKRHIDDTMPESLKSLLEDPRVFAVGMKMESVAKNLERHHKIKMSNPTDLNNLAIQKLKRDDLDLGRYDLDKLVKTVFGKHMDVVRPQKKIPWYVPFNRSYWQRYYYWNRRKLSMEKIQYATIDAYLCYLLGSELLDMKLKHTHVPASSSSSSKTTNNNKKKNNTNTKKNKKRN